MLLRDVSGAFRPHRLACLMGASGAGKTTLMDCLAGRKTSRAFYVAFGNSPFACWSFLGFERLGCKQNTPHGRPEWQHHKLGLFTLPLAYSCVFFDLVFPGNSEFTLLLYC